MHGGLRPMPERSGEMGMIVAALARKIAVITALAAICASATGCVSDIATPTVDNGNHQLRYYGGPKYPMWNSQ
jgi:hypothetical protein